MLAGTFFLGLNDFQKKKYLKQGISEGALLGLHLFFGGLVLFPVVLIFGIPEIKDSFWIAFTGTVVLNVISQDLFIRAFSLSEASTVAPLRLIIPPMVIVTGFVFLGERPSLVGVLGIFITMAGLWFLLFPSVSFSALELRDLKNGNGIILGLLGSILFAVSFPLDKITVVSSSALFASSLIFSVVGLITIFINTIKDFSFSREMFLAIKNNPIPIFLTSLSLGAGVFLTNQALNYSFVAYASSLKRLQALWTIVLSGIFLREKNIRRKLLATMII